MDEISEFEEGKISFEDGKGGNPPQPLGVTSDKDESHKDVSIEPSEMGSFNDKIRAEIQQNAAVEILLPDEVDFSSTISKGSGKRLILNIPCGFVGLLQPGETCMVKLTFPYRKIAKAMTKIQKIKEKKKE